MTKPPSANTWIRECLRDRVRLGARARVLLLAVVIAALLADSAFGVFGPEPVTPWRGLFGTMLTISIAAYVWRPTVATILIMLASIAAPFVGAFNEYLLALAVLTGLVVVTCSPWITGLYVTLVTVLLTAKLVVSPDGAELSRVAGTIAVAAASFAVGYGIDRMLSHARELAIQLTGHERAMAEQIEQERRLVADELHDIVAHDITIAVMHARVLARTDDPATREQSQTAIQEASMRALTDIRRILKIAGTGEAAPSGERGPETVELDAVVARSVTDLNAVGIEVEVVRADARVLDQSLVRAISRIIAECATNVLKHAAAATRVRIEVSTDDDAVALVFSDNSPAFSSAGLPSSGYGLERMRERVQFLGGDFSAAPLSPGWAVRAVLPLQS